MLAIAIRQYPFARLTKVAALTTLAAALAAGSASAEQTIGAQSVAARLASVALGDLEEAFWVCDYTATTRGPAGNDITVCNAVYDAIKERKFDGDFDKLLDWWRQNKVTRHDALAAADAMREPR
ncbi:MAG: hypothetical protein HYY28_17190 [Betaproteobacteria bacterium]|nr:hypothetical protein [Betaproteobacteria bacterium]